MVRRLPGHRLLPMAAAIAALPLSAQDLPEERTVVGVTLAARGVVEALDLIERDARSLARRSDVFDADAVLTGDSSQIQIRMVDDSVLSLRANSELVIAEYEFDEETEEGRAVMELVSGGLRTLTGRLSPDDGEADYELRTAVGSIGIRGTHYEAVQSGDGLFLAVWEGEIEVDVTAGAMPASLVLGPENEFSYALVGPDGSVSYFLEPPGIFAEGYTEDDATDEESDDDSEVVESEDEEEEGTVEEDADEDETGEESEEAELDAVEEDDEPEGLGADTLIAITTPAVEPESERINLMNLPTPPAVVAERAGTATFGDLMSLELAGSRTDYEVTLQFQINFSQGTVDGGQLELLSPTDGDRWFATFEGGILGNELMIGPVLGENRFNYAVHNDLPAEGSLSGQFFGPNADRVSGSFNLNEVADPGVGVSGDYTIGEGN